MMRFFKVSNSLKLNNHRSGFYHLSTETTSFLGKNFLLEIAKDFQSCWEFSKYQGTLQAIFELSKNFQTFKELSHFRMILKLTKYFKVSNEFSTFQKIFKILFQRYLI